MLFWLFIILIFLGLALVFFAFWIEAKHRKKQNNSASSIFFDEVGEITYYIGIWTAGISGVIAALMLIFIISQRISADGKKAVNEQVYNGLVYKAQTEAIRDEFGFVNKEYVDEVQAWNQNLAKYRAYSQNFWIGIFYPERVAEGLEFIDFDNIRMKD